MLLMQNTDLMKTNCVDDLVKTFDLANDLLLLPFSWSLLHLSSHCPSCHELIHFVLDLMPYSLPSSLPH
jgi:hypothetical protein